MSSSELVQDDAWKDVQKRTFTKWVNAQLRGISERNVADLGADLTDGILLILLMEKLSKTKLGKKYIEKPKIRFHKLDNMTDVWNFIKREKIKLANIGPEDIVDGNLKLILGLIWTLILKYQIENIVVERAEGQPEDKRTNPLLQWVQAIASKYPSLPPVNNFTKDFQDGRLLNALLHNAYPNQLAALHPEKLSPANGLDNIQQAMDLAEHHFGVPKLMEAKELHTMPEEKSVMTYLSEMYKGLNKPPIVPLPGGDDDRKKKEAEEAAKRAAEEAERKRREEEERKKLEAEKKRAAEEAERKRLEEEERKKLEEEALLLAQRKKQKEAEEQAKREEEQRQREAAEAKRKQEEEEKRQQEELLMLQRQKQKQKEDEDRLRQEQERLEKMASMAGHHDGRWSNDDNTAGGGPHESTYRNNPQLEIHVPKDMRAKVTLKCQPVPNKAKPTKIGFAIAAKTNPFGVNLPLTKDENLIADSGFVEGDEVTLEVDLQADQSPYIAIPATFEPGEEGRFSIDAVPVAIVDESGSSGDNNNSDPMLMGPGGKKGKPGQQAGDSGYGQQGGPGSSASSGKGSDSNQEPLLMAGGKPRKPSASSGDGGRDGLGAGDASKRANKLEIKPVSIPEPYCTKISMNGEWTDMISGGMHDLPTWRKNPQYMLKVYEPTRVHIYLSQPSEGADFRGLNSISFHVVKNQDDDATEYVLTAHDVLGHIERVAKNGKVVNYSDDQIEVDKEVFLDFKQETPVFIVPSCWEAGATGQFNLTVFADKHISMKYVGGGVEFPHKSSLEGEWTDETAGGGKGLPTWRTNPAYKIVPKEPMRCAIILARAKVNIISEDGVSFMEKKNVGIGFHLVKNKTNALGDVVLPSCTVLSAVKKYAQQGEVSINYHFTDKDVGQPFYIVASTYDPGHCISYQLIVNSEKPLPIEALPTKPKHLHARSLDGQWIKGKSSGGYQGTKSWRENPQFVVAFDKPANCSFILRQNCPYANAKSAGLHVVKNRDSRGTAKVLPAHDIVVHSREGEYTYFKHAELSVEADKSQLQPGTYFIVPSTYNIGDENPFTLTIMSDVPATRFEPADPNAPDSVGSASTIKSQWKGNSAGGNSNEPTWKNNPQFLLTVPAKTSVNITISQPEDDDMKGMGFMVLKDANNGKKLENIQSLLKLFKHEDKYAYVMMPEITMDIELDAGRYVIVPSTYQKGQEAEFTISASSAGVEVKLVELK